MTTRTSKIETRSFELEEPGEPERIIRGRIESPLGAEESAERHPTILVVHGFKGFMNWGFFPELSHRLAEAGFITVSFNMSGSGVGEDLERFTDAAGFEGNTPTRELDDLEVVRGFVASDALPWADPERLGIVGHSLGGGVALLHAARHPGVKALVGWAAISTVDRFGEDAAEVWRRDGHLSIPNARTGQVHRLGLGWLEEVETRSEELDIPAACRSLEVPTLLVQGTEDLAVPHAEAEKLAAAFPPGGAELLSIAGAGHTFGAAHPLDGVPVHLGRALEATLAHFRRHLS
jgi:uncharacterized protein